MADFLRKLKQLNQIFQGRRKAALSVCLVTIFTAVIESFGLTMIFPIMQVMVNGSLGGKLGAIFDPLLLNFPSGALLPVLCCIFLLLLVLKFVGQIIHIIVLRGFIWEIRFDWSNTIFSKYLYSQYAYILSNRQGVLMSNVFEETHKAAICLSRLTDFFGKSILLVALYVPLFLINKNVTLCISFVIVLLLLVTNNVSKRFAQKTGKRRLQLKQKLYGWAAEGIGGEFQIKIFGLENFFTGMFFRTSKKIREVELRFDIFKKIPTFLGDLVLGLILVAVIFYIHFFSETDINTFIPTIGIFIIIGQKMLGNITQLASLRLQIIALLPSLVLAHNLTEQLIPQETIGKGEIVEKITEDVVFDHVTFGYSPQQDIFSDFNLTIPYGKMTAIVGPSGAGKSTIANLLLGIIRPEDGQIIANGCNLKNIQLSSWRSCIGYVSQEPYLFNMSIRENIALASRNKSEKDIVSAAQKAFAHEFIVNLPEGYDTLVGDRGVKLSGGQRQRIAIARAIIKEPDLFIFDEATSSLDNESEKMIQKAIEKIAKEKTILVIAHRLSTIESADFVYDLNEKNKFHNER